MAKEFYESNENLENQPGDDMTSNPEVHYVEPLLSWRVHEYPVYQRTKWWYMVFGVIAVGLILLSVIPNFIFDTPNYTFAILITLITVVILANANSQAQELDVTLTTEGVLIGQQFFDYDKFQEFSVIFKPQENLKVLYLEYKNSIMPRLSLQLNEADPISVREILAQFLDEDFSRTDEANSDFFSRILKF